MPGLDEVLYYLNGIALLLKQKQEGFGWLDLTMRGLVRSFWAFVWCLPAFVVIWVSWRLYYLAGMPADTRAGVDFFVNVRPTMLEDTSWTSPFIETYTSEKLAWATTPAVHSYEKFPPMEDYEGLVAAYAASVA